MRLIPRMCGVLLITLFVTRLPIQCSADEFKITRGVNISHWLSQSHRRGEERRFWFVEKDVALIAKIGYDHIRLPIDEEQMWDEEGNKQAEAFELLHHAIRWARKDNLRVVVDLHILRSHHFNAKQKPLFTDSKEQEKFIGLWRDLSTELKQYPNEDVAYELMNEPVADDPQDWNRIVDQLVKAIRRLEPERKIVIGSNRWQSPETFDVLKIPDGDRNLILSFHFYKPMLITHYRASWTGVGQYQGAVNYPGWLVNPDEIKQLDPNQQELVRRNNGQYNREVMAAMIAKPLAMAKRTGLPLYCGEWGCIKKCPRQSRLAWYRDVRTMLESHNIAWANWDYKGGFGIAESADEPDDELIGVLTGSR